MIELSELRQKLHQEVNNLRSIEHYLKQPHLENLWILSNKKKKDELIDIIEKKDKQKLMNWIRRHPSLELGEKTIRQLREDAKELFITNYSRMDKLELLMALKNREKEPIEPSSLSRREMILEITKLIEEMSGLFPEAKIKEDYLSIDPAAVNFSKEIILEAFNWVREVHGDQFQKVKRVKMLLSDEMWERYKAWEDFSDHREVVLLNEGLQNLRKAIVTSSRPDLFKSTKVKSLIKKLEKAKEK